MKDFSELKKEAEFTYNEIFVDNHYKVIDKEIYDKVVIDAGANIGMFSIFVSEFKPKRILSIEPQNENFERLITNIIRYAIPNITVINKALYSEDDKKIYIEGSEGIARIAKISTVGDDTVDANAVLTITLSNLLNKYVKKEDEIVLKIDCEGVEYDVLMNKDILRKFSYIYAEIHELKNNHTKDLRNWIISCGFNCVNIEPMYWLVNGKPQKTISETCKFVRAEQ